MQFNQRTETRGVQEPGVSALADATARARRVEKWILGPGDGHHELPPLGAEVAGVRERRLRFAIGSRRGSESDAKQGGQGKRRK
jgi:hypothetical protein